MHQEIELALLPHHPLIKFLEPGIYSLSYFQILFSEIFNSGFFNPISSSQRIRVLNYKKWTDMIEQSMCITCEENWYEGHECKNSCLVVFNPFDRDDDIVEEPEEDVEENEMVLNVEQEFIDQTFEETMQQEVEKGFKEKSIEEQEEKIKEQWSVLASKEYSVDVKGGRESEKLGEVSIVHDSKVFDRIYEWKVDRNTNDCYDAEMENIKEIERMQKVQPFFCQSCVEGESENNLENLMSGKEAGCFDELHFVGEKISLDHMLEGNLEQTVKGVPMFEDLKVLDDNRERELELGFMSSKKFFEVNSAGQLKQCKKLVPACAYICEKNSEYKGKLKSSFRKSIFCFNVKKGCYVMSRLKFDPGGKRCEKCRSFNLITIGEQQRSEWGLVSFIVKAVNNKTEQRVSLRFPFDPGGYAS